MSNPTLGIDIVTTSARTGVRDLDALVPAAQRVERAVDKMSASVANDLKVIEGGAQNANRGFAALGGGNIQNVAFQIGDFATQVGAGTSASVALAQQLPQLLGGFGALGAILGAVVAIGVPVASAFFAAGDGAKDLDDRLSDLEKALKNVEDAMAISGGTDALVERYGKATEAVRDLSAAMVETAAMQAKAQAQALTEGQWAQFADQTAIAIPDVGQVSSELRAQLEQAFDGATVGADRLRAALKIAQPEAAALQALIADARTQESIEGQADAFARVREYLSGIKDEYGNITPEAQAMRAETERVEDALRRAAGMTDALSSGMSGAVGAINAAGDAASRVADEIARAVGNLNSLAAGAQAALREAQIRSQFRGDAVGTAGALANARSDISGLDPILRDALQPQKDAYVAAEKERVRLQEELASWTKAQAAAGRKSGGGGGGGKSDTERELEREQKARDRIIEGLKFEAEMVGQSDVARRIANATRQAGVEIMSAEGQQIADLIESIHAAEEAQNRLEEANKFAADSFADMFTGAITGANSLKDSLTQLMAQLGRMLVNRAFMSILTNSAFGSSAGGQWLGGLLSMDGGGFTGNGARSGGMDGKGGFLAMLHPQETVIDHTRGQSSVPTAVTVDVRGATGNAEIRRMVAEGVAAGMNRVRREVPAIVANSQKRS